METQASISEWAIKTFGEPESGLVLVERLKEEVYELAAVCAVYNNTKSMLALNKMVEEIADVVIVAYQVCNWYGVNLHDMVNKKMEKNRKREWRITKPGVGQHKKEKEV
jgi:NTP pyrophosphatase (non-canonical NTP hydrolase)